MTKPKSQAAYLVSYYNSISISMRRCIKQTTVAQLSSPQTLMALKWTSRCVFNMAETVNINIRVSAKQWASLPLGGVEAEVWRISQEFQWHNPAALPALAGLIRLDRGELSSSVWKAARSFFYQALQDQRQGGKETADRLGRDHIETLPSERRGRRERKNISHRLGVPFTFWLAPS